MISDIPRTEKTRTDPIVPEGKQAIYEKNK